MTGETAHASPAAIAPPPGTRAQEGPGARVLPRTGPIAISHAAERRDGRLARDIDELHVTSAPTAVGAGIPSHTNEVN